MASPSNKRSLQEQYPKHVLVPILILLTTIALTVALFLPILTLKTIFHKNTFSVLSGIESLWLEGNHGLAVIIVFFSVIFPYAKLFSLFWLWYFKLSDEHRKRLLYWLEMLGKWSMLDVFVVAIIIVSVKFGWMTQAVPEHGVYWFGGAILSSMILTMLIDRVARPLSKESDKLK